MTVPKEPLTFAVHVQPGARKSSVVGFHDGVLRIKIAAPPVDGKANRELIDFMSRILGLRKSNISIEKGETSKHKIISASGITRNELEDKIALASSSGASKLL
jgi:uncharacterized protein (TIGR00251 family)